MTNWGDLPRDIHLQVIKHFDIDTRIKTGIIHKLKVPPKLIIRLVKVMTYHVHVMLSTHPKREIWTYLLQYPYYNHVSNIGPHNPDVWLDQWYEKEWPIRKTQYLSWYKEGHERYGIVERF